MKKTKPARKTSQMAVSSHRRKLNLALLALNLALATVFINTFYLPVKDRFSVEKTLAFNGTVPSPPPSFSPTPTSVDKPLNSTQIYISPKELEPFIEKYAGLYNVNRELMKKMAFCESSFNRFAVHGPYKGLYQFHSSTWTATRKRMGLNPDISKVFDTEEAVKTTAFKISQDGAGAWPVCGKL